MNQFRLFVIISLTIINKWIFIMIIMYIFLPFFFNFSLFFIGDAMVHKKLEREIVLIEFGFLFYREIKIWKKWYAVV